MRQGQSAAAQAMMSEGYKSRARGAGARPVAQAIGHSKDATFPMRSVDNDRATLTGVLTGGTTQPMVIHLVKEGGAWKIDKVTLGERVTRAGPATSPSRSRSGTSAPHGA